MEHSPHWYDYRLPKNSVSDLHVSTKNFICSIGWSRVDVVLDQYVVPSFLTTMYFAPLILYASLNKLANAI